MPKLKDRAGEPIPQFLTIGDPEDNLHYLTDDETFHTVIDANYNGDQCIVLPPGQNGMDLLIYRSIADSLAIGPAPGEIICLNGTNLSADALITVGSPAVSDYIHLIWCGTKWRNFEMSGTWILFEEEE